MKLNYLAEGLYAVAERLVAACHQRDLILLNGQLIVIFFELLIQAQDDISALRRAQRS